jgi:hypothetical protein
MNRVAAHSQKSGKAWGEHDLRGYLAPSAENDLAALWTSAPDRNAVAAAADAIDAALQQDPLSQGESRSGITRMMFQPPLAVCFDVYASERRVLVWAVGHSRPLSP